jgi:hypothetical protein
MSVKAKVDDVVDGFTGLGDHPPPESVITFDRNTQVTPQISLRSEQF